MVVSRVGCESRYHCIALPGNHHWASCLKGNTLHSRWSWTETLCTSVGTTPGINTRDGHEPEKRQFGWFVTTQKPWTSWRNEQFCGSYDFLGLSTHRMAPRWVTRCQTCSETLAGSPSHPNQVWKRWEMGHPSYSPHKAGPLRKMLFSKLGRKLFSLFEKSSCTSLAPF